MLADRKITEDFPVISNLRPVLQCVNGTEQVLQFQGGDESAFEELVRLWDRKFLELAARLLGDLHDAEDARQMAWIKIYRGLPRLTEATTFPAWALRIVVNTCRDRQRQQQTTAELQARAPALTASAHATPIIALEQGETRNEVMAALQRLPQELRECLVLKHFHNMNITDIAKIVERPRTSIYTMLDQALSRLRNALLDQQLDSADRKVSR